MTPGARPDSWTDDDLASAIADEIDARCRCPKCGLTPDDGWYVFADIVHCASCEDVEREAKRMHKRDQPGERVSLEPVETADDVRLHSSSARYTIEGLRGRRAGEAT